MNVVEKKPAEEQVVLSSLGVGDLFRLPNVSFSDAITDDEGANFYWVTLKKKEELIDVVSIDHKNERRLPKETLVVKHQVTIEVASAS